MCVLAYYLTSNSMFGHTASSGGVKLCGVVTIAENRRECAHKRIHAPPHTCENRPAKLPAPQMKDTHKEMKADKCSRAKVTNWPTRESHLHFKRLHCLLAHSSPSKTCFPMFLTKQHSANRSVLVDVPSLMSPHTVPTVPAVDTRKLEETAHTPRNIHRGFVDWPITV